MESCFKTYLEEHREELKALSDHIHQHPEVAYEEHDAAQTAHDFLTRHEFTVIRNYCDLKTAWRTQSGTGKPTFAFVSEFDALPEVGHGCGHNLICMAGIAAFMATAERLNAEGLPGKVVLLGTPAEESGGGKVIMQEHHCLDGLDAVMMVHPACATKPDTGSTAIKRYTVTFHGQAAHAAGNPELGINALDAVMLLFQGINAYRQQLPETARIHGIVQEGGVAPNIIPERASCLFFLRARDEVWMERIDKRFLNMVRGAELMTGTKADIRPYQKPYRSRKPNAPMNAVYLEAARKAGLEPIVPAQSGRGSSDFGNFSQVIPGIHPYFAITDGEIPSHSKEFCRAAGSDLGFDNALAAAEAMAETGWKYLTDAAFRQAVSDDFLGR